MTENLHRQLDLQENHPEALEIYYYLLTIPAKMSSPWQPSRLVFHSHTAFWPNLCSIRRRHVMMGHRRPQTAAWNSHFHGELDAVALLQNLHQRLCVVLGRLLQGDSFGQTVGHKTAGVLVDPLIRHRDQTALSHSFTCGLHQAVSPLPQAAFTVQRIYASALNWPFILLRQSALNLSTVFIVSLFITCFVQGRVSGSCYSKETPNRAASCSHFFFGKRTRFFFFPRQVHWDSQRFPWPPPPQTSINKRVKLMS